MAVIVMNRFKIHPQFADAFYEQWKNRESHLSEFRGFLRFYLLKAQSKLGAEFVEFASHTHWLDWEAFETWLSSAQMKRSHSSAASVPREAYLGPAEWTAYEIVLDEIPGRRTDFRSAALDLKVESVFSKESEAQKKIQQRGLEARLPPINIGALEGRILEILVRSIGAKRGLEIGTLGGYSATWLLRGMGPEGKLLSLEKDPTRASHARRVLAENGFEKNIEILGGPAQETLKNLEGEVFDFVFIDADKAQYGVYVRWAVQHLRKGGLILADNAFLWGGMNYFEEAKVIYPPKGRLDSFDENEFLGMSECWKELAYHPELLSVILPTGEGLGVAIKI